jgi:hypothetical protein
LYLRAFPLDASYGFEIKFPDQVRAISDPRAQTVQNKHFTFTATSAFRGNVAKSTVHMRVLADRVEPALLAKYTEDMRAIARIATGTIAIPKSAIKGPSPTVAANKDFAKVLRDRLEETISKTTDAIKSGKLSGDDLANSYCMRSDAHTNLGSLKDALADATQALKVTPNSSGAFYCRGNVHFAMGEFDKSAADFSKAIALGVRKPRFFTSAALPDSMPPNSRRRLKISVGPPRKATVRPAFTATSG